MLCCFIDSVKIQKSIFSEPSSCPENYKVRFRNSCYKFVTVKANWTHSEKKCKEDGAELVVMESAEENTFIRNYIISKEHLNNGEYGNKLHTCV